MSGLLALAGCGADLSGVPRIASLEIAPADTTISLGETFRLRALALDDRGRRVTDVGIGWSSANPLIVNVSNDGVVRGMARGGPVRITAAAGGQSAVAQVTVRFGASASPAVVAMLARLGDVIASALQQNEAAIPLNPRYVAELEAKIALLRRPTLATETAARVIFDGMKDLGLMKGDTDDALAGGAHALFFPHGLGHMMGLDVHDMESLGEDHVGYAGEKRSSQFGLKSLRLARPLESGFVLTIEPGIYFIPQLIDDWRSRGHCADFIAFDALERWQDFGGVRNEEDYVVTETGARRLGPRKPQTEDEIAAVRAQ